MMAKTIVTYCDPCLEDGTESRATTWQLSILAPGARRPIERELDLCGDHAKPYAELVEYLSDNARTKPAVPKLDPASTPAAPVTTEKNSEPEADRTCPACGHVCPTVSGYRTHTQEKHGVTPAELDGTAKLPCPEEGCPRKFTAPQGVAAHQRAAHGRVVAA